MSLPEFRALLEARLGADASERARIDDEIRTRWERPAAVLISDMSGFSRITREDGILHFLSLIRRMQVLCEPLIAQHGGRVVKAVADNLYACFDSAQAAIDAAVAMHEACRGVSRGRRPNETIELGIGIAWGPILDIEGQDFFGDAVNIASKLGEDVAEGSDILITREAMEMVALPPRWRLVPGHRWVSEVEIDFVFLREHDQP